MKIGVSLKYKWKRSIFRGQIRPNQNITSDTPNKKSCEYSHVLQKRFIIIDTNVCLMDIIDIILILYTQIFELGWN